MFSITKSSLALRSLCQLSLLLGVTTSLNALAADYCQNASAIQKLSPELADANLTCLDSFSSDGKETVIFYQEQPIEKITVVTAYSPDHSMSSFYKDPIYNGASDGKRPNSVLLIKELSNPALFPDSCGDALMSARVLPGSNQIAILYDHDVIRIVDLNSQSATKVFDPRPDNLAYLCYGYAPNADALRDEVSIHPKSKSIQFEYSDWNDLETVCETVSLLPEEIESVQNRIETMKRNLSSVEGRLLKEQDEERREYYQKQLKDIQSVIQSDQDTLKTGKKCHEQAKSKSGVLHY